MAKSFPFRLAWGQFFDVLKRDTLSVASAFVAFGAYLFTVWHNKWPSLFYDEKLVGTWLFAAASGISLFLAIRLWSRSEKEKWVLSFLGALVLVGFTYFHFNLGDIKVFRSFQWIALTHLLVALTPLRGMGKMNSAPADERIWRFNWYLLTRFIFGGIFCGVMFLGLAGAMGAVDKLFDVKIHGDWYESVFGFVAFIISVFQILSTISDTKIGPQSEQVTTDLRRLAQYLLTPLSLIYFLIAYAYIGKILLVQSWPQGVVGPLISALAGAVFLTYLIQRPLTKVTSFPKWMSEFWRWSFVLLIPPLIVLLMAIWRRTGDYGWTEKRLLALYLALWALAMCAYYFKPSKRGIAVLPLSLAFLSVVTFVGPMSPHFVAKRSQTGEMRELISKNGGKLVDGKYVWATTPPYDDAKRLRNLIEYFCREYHPSAVYESIGVDNQFKEREWKRYSECYFLSQTSDNTLSKGQMVLNIEGLADKDADALPNLYVNEEYHRHTFRAGGIAFAHMNISMYDMGKSRVINAGGGLKFDYKCCGTSFTWNAPSGKKVSFDIEKAIRDKTYSVEVSDGNSKLNVWIIDATALQNDKGMLFTGKLSLEALFTPAGMPVEREKLETF